MAEGLENTFTELKRKNDRNYFRHCCSCCDNHYLTGAVQIFYCKANGYNYPGCDRLYLRRVFAKKQSSRLDRAGSDGSFASLFHGNYWLYTEWFRGSLWHYSSWRVGYMSS